MSEAIHSKLENEILTGKVIDNICRELARRGWSLKTLADRADLPYETVKKLLNGKITRPSFICIWQIANAFGCSTDSLAGRSDPSRAALEQISENASELLRIISNISALSEHIG